MYNIIYCLCALTVFRCLEIFPLEIKKKVVQNTLATNSPHTLLKSLFKTPLWYMNSLSGMAIMKLLKTVCERVLVWRIKTAGANRTAVLTNLLYSGRMLRSTTSVVHPCE